MKIYQISLFPSLPFLKLRSDTFFPFSSMDHCPIGEDSRTFIKSGVSCEVPTTYVCIHDLIYYFFILYLKFSGERRQELRLDYSLLMFVYIIST